MHDDTHRYIVERAVALLKNDALSSHDELLSNLSVAASQYLIELTEGTLHADRAGESLNVYIKVRNLVTDLVEVPIDWITGIFGADDADFEVPVYERYICNMASFTHYYDPSTNAGLDLSEYGSLETWVEGGIALLAQFVLQGTYADIELDQDVNFRQPYRSAADCCQDHYDRALQIWNSEETVDGRYAWSAAMIHLGWACHFIADCATSPHTVSNEFWGHSKYEDKADPLEHNGAYHIHAVGENVHEYGINPSPRQIAIDVATETRQELNLYKQGNSSNYYNPWYDGLKLAIPRAEKATARLIAKFLTDVGITAEIRTLQVKVLNVDGTTPVGNALLFYRKPGTKWEMVICDTVGCCELALKHHELVELRPVQPGFMFTGKHLGNETANVDEFAEPQSPVAYTNLPVPLGPRPVVYLFMAPREGVDLFPELRVAPMLFPFQFFERLEPVGALSPHVLHSDVTQAIGEQMTITVVGMRRDSKADLQVNNPDSAHIRIEVYRLLNVATGAFISTKQQLVNVLDEHEQRIGLQRNRAAGQQPELAEQAREELRQPTEAVREVLQLLQRLPTRNRRFEGDRQRIYTGPRLAANSTLLGNIEHLLLPSPNRYEVRAEICKIQDYVGVGAAAGDPLIVQTDESSTVWLRVTPGNQAGRLRLRLSLTRPLDGAVDDMLCSREVELLIKPRNDGGVDTAPVVLPRLENQSPAA